VQASSQPSWLRVLGRHQLASIVSTIVDFGTMMALVELLSISPVIATAAGASAGALTNFLMNRHWVFRVADGRISRQALRYAMVSLASAGWNTLGEHVAVRVLGVQYLLGRAVVAVAVSLGWNFPLQRGFVFRDRKEEPA
jgi:putative flippase GtrA